MSQAERHAGHPLGHRDVDSRRDVGQGNVGGQLADDLRFCKYGAGVAEDVYKRQVAARGIDVDDVEAVFNYDICLLYTSRCV